jgi:hypothetical protein
MYIYVNRMSLQFFSKLNYKLQILAGLKTWLKGFSNLGLSLFYLFFIISQIPIFYFISSPFF